MTSSNGNIFRVTGLLCVTQHNCQWRGASMFSLICDWTNSWVNNGDAGDLRRHHSHYDVTVIRCVYYAGIPWLTVNQTVIDFNHTYIDLEFEPWTEDTGNGSMPTGYYAQIREEGDDEWKTMYTFEELLNGTQHYIFQDLDPNTEYVVRVAPFIVVHGDTYTGGAMAASQKTVKAPGGRLLTLMITSWNENIFHVTGLCEGNPVVTGGFSSQRPVTRSFDVFFDLRLNKRLSKQSWHWWFETPSHSLWRHCNVKQQQQYIGLWNWLPQSNK